MVVPETPKALNLFKAAAVGTAIPPTIFLYRTQTEEIRSQLASGTSHENFHRWFRSQIGDTLGNRLVLRPSYPNEDIAGSINAGNYASHIDIENDPEPIFKALTAFLREWQALDPESDRQWPELIVQQYIPRQVHGVIQTVDPVTSSRDYCVVATTTGDLDVTDGAPDTKTVFARIEPNNKKKLEIAFGESDLSDEVLVDLLDIALPLEQLFNSSPVDIEFGYFGRKIFIFQVRPATVSRRSDPIVEFQKAPLAPIAPAYKEIYTRHAKKRKLLYSYLHENDILYPRSFIVDREFVGTVNRLRTLIRADQIYLPKGNIARPRRKEDFDTIPLTDLDICLDNHAWRHVLVTEAPIAAKSGYLHITEEPLVEFVEGGFSEFERGSPVHRIRLGDLNTAGSKLFGLRQIVDKLSTHLAGGVAEWIQDRKDRLWLYDATPISADEKFVNLEPKPLSGERILLSPADVKAIQSRTRYPISVYAEEEELRGAFAIELADIIGRLPENGAFHVSADYPATALAVFTLFPSFTGFQFGAGSVLCHLALICYSRGFVFQVGN